MRPGTLRPLLGGVARGDGGIGGRGGAVAVGVVRRRRVVHGVQAALDDLVLRRADPPEELVDAPTLGVVASAVWAVAHVCLGGGGPARALPLAPAACPSKSLSGVCPPAPDRTLVSVPTHAEFRNHSVRGIRGRCGPPPIGGG